MDATGGWKTFGYQYENKVKISTVQTIEKKDDEIKEKDEDIKELKRKPIKN